MAATPQGFTASHSDRAITSDLTRFRELLESGGSGPYFYVVLLGLDARDFLRVLRAVDRGLPYRAFEQFVRNTGLPAEKVADVIGVPRRTLTRRKQTGRFPPDESDRLLRAARVFGTVLGLYDGDRDAARDWLQRKRSALGGAVPLDLARTEIGARAVETLVHQLRHGVFP